MSGEFHLALDKVRPPGWARFVVRAERAAAPLCPRSLPPPGSLPHHPTLPPHRQTPKMLGALRHAWAPAAFVAGFKLETDEGILVKKAAKSIRAYGLHCVVANILETRKERVLLVTPGAGCGGGEGACGAPSADGVAVEAISRDPAEPFIEKQLVSRVVALHRRYMAAACGAGA